MSDKAVFLHYYFLETLYSLLITHHSSYLFIVSEPLSSQQAQLHNRLLRERKERLKDPTAPWCSDPAANAKIAKRRPHLATLMRIDRTARPRPLVLGE